MPNPTWWKWWWPGLAPLAMVLYPWSTLGPVSLNVNEFWFLPLHICLTSQPDLVSLTLAISQVSLFGASWWHYGGVMWGRHDEGVMWGRHDDHVCVSWWKQQPGIYHVSQPLTALEGQSSFCHKTETCNSLNRSLEPNMFPNTWGLY